MDAPDPRRLIIVRHAAGACRALPKVLRPLSPQGRRDAHAVGRWLADHGLFPDLVLVSPALRARETWQLAAETLSAPVAPVVVPEAGLLKSGAESASALVRRLPASCRTALLLGHLNTVRALVPLLAAEADGDTLVRLRRRVPAPALAVLALPDAWAATRPGCGVLTDFAAPRGRPVST